MVSLRRLQVKTGYTDDSDFDPDKVKKGSVAAAGLCKWVHAMVVYNRVAKVVGPKRAALAEAESTLAQAMADLGEKQAMLKVTLQRLIVAGTTRSLFIFLVRVGRNTYQPRPFRSSPDLPHASLRAWLQCIGLNGQARYASAAAARSRG